MNAFKSFKKFNRFPLILPRDAGEESLS